MAATSESKLETEGPCSVVMELFNLEIWISGRYSPRAVAAAKADEP